MAYVNYLTVEQLQSEFDRQVENLLKRDYSRLAGISEDSLLMHILPLKEKVVELSVLDTDVEKGYLPFVLVMKSDLLVSEQAMALTLKDGKTGVTILRPHTSGCFKTIEDVAIPDGMAYLLVEIDRGKANINLPPCEAMKLIKSARRSPLNIDEGIAIVTHFPEFLLKNNCFSLLASRTEKDKRVPAIWINAKKQPNLGWCWDGNPHTWLGSASAMSRIGIG
jgi:hypothetical protein